MLSRTISRIRTARPRSLLPVVLRRHFPEVTSVADALQSVEVEVTRKDCGRAAKPGDATACALARACERQYSADGAIIGLGISYLVCGEKAVRFQTPQRVSREITSFDRGVGFAPGTYSLNPPGGGCRLGYSNGRKGVHNGSRPQKHIVHRRTVGVRSLVEA